MTVHERKRGTPAEDSRVRERLGGKPGTSAFLRKRRGKKKRDVGLDADDEDGDGDSVGDVSRVYMFFRGARRGLYNPR